MNIRKKLTEWQTANLLTAQQAEAIRAYEDAQPSATAFIWRHGLLGLGILTIAIGLIAIIASNWSAIPASFKLGTHLVVNLGTVVLLFHWWRQGLQTGENFEGGLIIKSILVLTLMALIGQIMHTQAKLDDTLLLWWTLITPMLLWLGRSRVSYIIWTILSISLIFMHLSSRDEPVYFFALLIGFVQLYTVLPLFAFWRNNKPDWADLGRKHALVISIIIINIMLIAPFGHRHEWWYNKAEYAHNVRPFLTLYGWEIALIGNIILTYLLTCIRYKTLSPLTIAEQTDTPTRIAFVHLLIALLLSFIPQWFGWFILYWFCVGYIGLRCDDKRVVGTAISLLAIRIIVLYFDLTQSLMTTGVLMILSGIGVLYAVKTYPRWRAVILSATGGKA